MRQSARFFFRVAETLRIKTTTVRTAGLLAVFRPADVDEFGVSFRIGQQQHLS
jgi:hypothetical protein